MFDIHRDFQNAIKRGKEEIPTAALLQLSSANIERTGLFLMDTGETMYLLVGSAVGDQVCQDVFDKPNFASIPDGMVSLIVLIFSFTELTYRGQENTVVDCVIVFLFF